MSSRAQTTNGIHEDQPAGGVAGDQKIINVAAMVDEIVHRPGWVKGNNMGFQFQAASLDELGFLAYEGDALLSAKLDILYLAAGIPSVIDLTMCLGSSQTIDIADYVAGYDGEEITICNPTLANPIEDVPDFIALDPNNGDAQLTGSCPALVGTEVTIVYTGVGPTALAERFEYSHGAQFEEYIPINVAVIECNTSGCCPNEEITFQTLVGAVGV